MNKTTDQALAAWVLEGPDSGPRESLDRALAATRRTSQRPGWSFPERWLPMQLTLARTPSLRPFLAIVVLALLVIAIAATALFVGSKRVPPPFGPARNGAIVFEQNGDLLIADAVDGAERALVSGPTGDSFPVFSNQGDRVAFLRSADDGFQLLSVRPDGSDLRTLASLPGELDGMRWSPDGSALLVSFSETGPAGFRLAVVDTDGSGFRELAIGMPADWASWRPGGRHIAFRGQLSSGTSAAFVADVDGTNVRRLPIDSSSDLDFEGLNWSPDGIYLAFMSGSREGGWRIGLADIDPAGVMTAIHPLKFDPDSVDEMLPAWSPDSTQLAFIHMKDNLYQVALGRVDGTGLRLVGPRTVDRNGLGYAWAPDGRTVLVASRQGETSMWSVDVETRQAAAIEAPTTGIPAWQRQAP
jgi:Tol biopolymer transport system component